MEISSRGLVRDTIPEIAWSGWGKQQARSVRADIRTGNLQNTNQMSHQYKSDESSLESTFSVTPDQFYPIAMFMMMMMMMMMMMKATHVLNSGRNPR
jgi:hypothetical protein